MRTRSSAPPRSSDLRLRGALLMPLCALAVHQLRYLLAFGSTASARLAHDGHAYMSSLEPFVLLAAALAVGGFAGAVARAIQTRPSFHARPRPPASPGLPREREATPRKPASEARSASPAAPVWALCAGILLSLYCGQELAEGLLAPGHAAGVAGVFGHGGWIAVPVSLLLGAALATTLRVSETLVRRIARHRVADHPRGVTGSPQLRRPDRSASDWRLEPQSGLMAGRAPPPMLSLT